MANRIHDTSELPELLRALMEGPTPENVAILTPEETTGEDFDALQGLPAFMEIDRRTLSRLGPEATADRVVAALRTLGRKGAVGGPTGGKILLTWGGWIDDPRELVEVPEVVETARLILDRGPDVLLALVDEDAPGTLAMLREPGEAMNLPGRLMLVRIGRPEMTVRALSGRLFAVAALVRAERDRLLAEAARRAS